MTATEVQTLLDEMGCAQCYVGLSVTQLVKLALLNRVSQLYPAFSFIQRAGITDEAQIAAINELVLSAKEHGWWDKCDLIYPFVGGTALAHSMNLKSSSFTITWNGAVTHDANGITGDGATGYGNLGYNASLSTIWTLNSGHVSVYRRTVGSLTATKAYLGVHSGFGIGVRLTTGVVWGGINTSLNAGPDFDSSAGVLGLIAVSRNSSSSKSGFSSSGEEVEISATSAVPTQSPVILARLTVGVGPQQLTNANLAGATVGSGITFSEYQLMAADWQAFQTALGRQV